MMIEVNFVTLFLAAVASMIVGFFWYSPMLFARPWMKLMGHNAKSMKSAQKQMGMTYGVSFILALVTGFVLTHVIAFSRNFYGYQPLQTGLMSGFFMWMGFVMPVQLTDVLFGSKKWMLFVINTGYQLVSLLVMGVVIGLLG